MGEFSRSDRQRLARCFGFEVMKPFGPLVGAGVMAILPWGTWVVGGPLALIVVAIMADEQRKIADGLAEVKTWGFPVEGYRDWLLAVTPAFDLELKRDVAIDLIAASLHAVNPSIVAERRGERVVRVTMRRIEMEGGERQPSVFVGDRKRLHEVRDRVLAPLHADVGIVAMRMGDKDTLAALVASPQAATAGAAFRDQAFVAPPDLQSLAHAGTSQLRPPQEAGTLKVRTDRLLYATGHVPTSAGSMTWAVTGMSILGGIAISVGTALGGGIGILIGAGIGTGMAWGMRKRDKGKLQKSLAEGTQWPFPVEGYDNWLLSGRPIMDIEFGQPVEEAALPEAFADRFVVTWLTDRVVRIESMPVIHFASQGIKSFYGGDPEVLKYVLYALTSLRDSHGIVAVRMGGYLDRRA